MHTRIPTMYSYRHQPSPGEHEAVTVGGWHGMAGWSSRRRSSRRENKHVPVPLSSPPTPVLLNNHPGPSSHRPQRPLSQAGSGALDRAGTPGAPGTHRHDMTQRHRSMEKAGALAGDADGEPLLRRRGSSGRGTRGPPHQDAGKKNCKSEKACSDTPMCVHTCVRTGTRHGHQGARALATACKSAGATHLDTLLHTHYSSGAMALCSAQGCTAGHLQSSDPKRGKGRQQATRATPRASLPACLPAQPICASVWQPDADAYDGRGTQHPGNIRGNTAQEAQTHIPRPRLMAAACWAVSRHRNSTRECTCPMHLACRTAEGCVPRHVMGLGWLTPTQPTCSTQHTWRQRGAAAGKSTPPSQQRSATPSCCPCWGRRQLQEAQARQAGERPSSDRARPPAAGRLAGSWSCWLAKA